MCACSLVNGTRTVDGHRDHEEWAQSLLLTAVPTTKSLQVLSSDPAAWPALLWQAIANVFLSHGDSDSELHNLSTQLTRLPLASHYHTSPVLQIPHGLCGAHLANPQFAAIPSSLEPRL